MIKKEAATSFSVYLLLLLLLLLFLHLSCVSTDLVVGHSYSCTLLPDEQISCYVNSSNLLDGSVVLNLQEESYVIGSSDWWTTLIVCIFLVLSAGLMSGMTIGLMSLDLMHLRILKESGTPEEQKYCKKIIPLVSKHHLLLVTLLLANAAAMESLPIFLDRLVPSPYIAIICSVTLILFFGEVIPQAICSRFGLAIGYYIYWLMWALIGICFIVAYPVAKLLDCILGKDKINFYRVDEIKELVKMHKLDNLKKTDDDGGGPLTDDEVRIIQGALNMREKFCDSNIYTPLEQVFALPTSTILDTVTINKIHECGHSRIPIYRKKKLTLSVFCL